MAWAQLGLKGLKEFSVKDARHRNTTKGYRFFQGPKCKSSKASWSWRPAAPIAGTPVTEGLMRVVRQE